MKSIIKAFSFAFLIIQLLPAAEWVSLGSKKPVEPRWTVDKLSENLLKVSFSLDGYQIEKFKNGKNKISFPKSISALKSGAPDLPLNAKSIIIPNLSSMSFSIIKSEYVEIEIDNIIPSKGNLTRDIDPNSVPLSYGKEYETDDWYPQNIVFMRDPYIMRSVRGQVIVMQPVQYNPIKKIARIYTNITISVAPNNEIPVNPLLDIPQNVASREFEEMYKKHFINYNITERYVTLNEQGSMLVLSHGDFIEEMETFVNWKNFKGIPTELVDVSEIGDVDQIAQFISDYYYENGTAFVLLVGDIDQIESIRRSEGAGSNSPSDNTFSFVAGDDYYPDLMIGRFSGETTEHIQTMVDRTISYEMNPDPNANWYKKGSGFASNQGPGDDNESDLEHLNNIRDILLNYTYVEIDQVYDPSGTVADGELAINEGRSIINYTGHGSNSSWGNGCPMNNTNVDGLNNTGKWPFIWSVACVNGEFHIGTCFAETWLRATDSEGNPTGAIATLMSTVNQGWNPPMEGQDEMNAIFVESYSENIKRTFGGISFNGMNQMNDSYGSAGYDETFYWTLFGDPSVVLRSDTPEDMEVQHDEVLLIGASEMSVNVGQSGALVAVSNDDLLLGSAYTDASGNVNILFSNSVEAPGQLSILVTAYNKIPYESSVNVIAPEGAYILLNNIALTNSEQEEQLSFGETAYIYATIQNVGQDTSSGLNVVLEHENGMVNIVNSEIFSQGISPDSEVVIGPYEVEVNWNLENGAQIDLILSIQDDSQTWEYETEMLVSAPVFRTQMMNIADNGNGVFDPGETVTLELSLENIGGSPLQNPTFNVTTSDPFLSVGDLAFENTLIWNNVENDNNIVNLNIEIFASSDAPLGHTSIAGIIIGSGESNYEHVYPLPITLGLMVEGFETANFMTYSWLHSGDSDWVINTDSHSGSFSAMSGDVGHGQSSELSIDMNIIIGGELIFWSKISSEDGNGSNDYLEFFIDDEPQNLLISGESDWTEYSVELPIGEHSLSWKYSKNEAITSGEDCAWIDNIQFPPGAVPPLNISFGDVNNDDVVNVLDVIVTVNYLIGYLQFDQQQVQNADMNLDGAVSINDVLMIVESALQ
jgi:hypothetical protein